ncbi:MAG: S9 family peptidase [Acidobacteria bacterium]|nr:S9 family peptidase [Acidobacteriota bacterium]
MRLFLFLGSLAMAAEWPLEKLYTRPFAWGTAPQTLTWAKEKPVLAFLWNESGNRFLDIYVWNAETKKRVRVTALDTARDEFNPLPDEKDERLKANKMPEAGLTAFDLAASGDRVAFAWRGDIYIAPVGGGPALRLTQTRAPEASPKFSSSGEWLAFTRGGELFNQNLKTGTLIQLSEGNVSQFQWAPDGKRLAYLSPARGTRTQVLTNYSGQFTAARPFQRNVAGDAMPAGEVFLVPAGGGKALKLADAKGAALPEWSPDSKSLLGVNIAENRKSAAVVVHDAATGRGRTVATLKDDRWVARTFSMWSPDNASIAYSSDADGFIHLYSVPAAGGDAVQLTRGAWELDTERFGYEPQWIAGKIYYSSTEAGTSERQFYSLQGAEKRRLSTGEGIHVGRVSEDGRFVALLSADLNNPFDLFVNGERVTRSPRPEFASYDWPRTRFVEFPSRGDRANVRAKILLPPGYDPARNDGKKWPCVFFIHGAGIASSVLKQWGSYQDHRFVFNAYLANKGYVLMDLDYRGSSGYGRDWRTGVYLHMGGPDLNDVLGAVDYLNGLGNVDMRRLGIWGVSYGGFMTNMALFQAPGTFKAGSSWAAVNDWENYNAGYTRERLTTPAENPEAYRRSSPITFSQGLKDNLLIVHGMVDSNVLFQDAVQLSEKLIQEKKHFEEIFYPQEDHGFVRDESLYDAFRRTAEFFEKHLR